MENANEEIVQLYLDDIIPNRFQPREVFDDQALKELAVSIREHGVIQPILVRKFGEKYEIIAGERRYKASTMAGLTKIPAIIKNLDDKEASKVALIENLQRRDLTPIEEARTYQKILDLDQMTQDQLAKTMGKSQSAVSNKLRLLTLPDEVQEALLNNRISERHARSLLNAPKSAQVSLLKEVIENKMTVRELDNKIKAMIGESGSDANPTNGGMAYIPNQNSLFNGGNVMNNNDPTAVDINRIREQSTDINVNNDKTILNTPKNMDNLLLGRNTSTPSVDTNRFIPNNPVPTQESNESGNELLGGGLLAGMPVIQEAPNNTNNVFTPPVIESITPEYQMANNVESNAIPPQEVVPAPEVNPYMVSNMNNNQEPTPQIENSNEQLPPQEVVPTPEVNPYMISNSRFEQPVVNINNEVQNTPTMEAPMVNPSTNLTEPQPLNDINSLFSTPAPEQIPINNEVVQQPMNNVMPVQTMSQPTYSSNENGDYSFNIDFSNIQIPKDKIEEMKKAKELERTSTNNNQQSTSNVTDGVSEVKNLVSALTTKGYKVSVDELNLDNEVQLIVKFIKG